MKSENVSKAKEYPILPLSWFIDRIGRPVVRFKSSAGGLRKVKHLTDKTVATNMHDFQEIMGYRYIDYQLYPANLPGEEQSDQEKQQNVDSLLSDGNASKNQSKKHDH